MYTNSTPAQNVGSDFASHVVTASVSGLVPNALYHVRLAATNSAGTTFGPDVTFTTGKLPAPGSPALGKTVNISLVSGLVLVKIHGVFVPLTELTQIPTNTEINALRHDQADHRHKRRHPPGERCRRQGQEAQAEPPTQSGTFGGAIFKITQARSGAGKGLATLAIVEGRSTAHRPTPSAPSTRPPTPRPPPPRSRPCSCSTPAPTASSAPRGSTAPPPSSGPNGRSLTAATAPSPTTSPTRCRSPTSSTTRRSSLHAGQSYLAKAALKVK